MGNRRIRMVTGLANRCIDALPHPPDQDPHEHVDHPHEGGRDLPQPPTTDERIAAILPTRSDQEAL